MVSGAKRGARVKSIAITSRHPWIHIFKPILLMSLDEYFKNPCKQVLQDLHQVLNSLKLDQVPILTLEEKKSMRFIVANRVPHYYPEFDFVEKDLKYYDPKDSKLELINMPTDADMTLSYLNLVLPLKIPLLNYESEIGSFSVTSLLNTLVNLTMPSASIKSLNGATFAWHPHLDNGPQTSPIIVLLFALLSEKRIVFLGHGKRCTELANCVLAATAFAAGGDFIPGTVNRCFPYASLANIELLLSVPGYIAGVTNPVFETQSSWWDILINLNTMTMSINITKKGDLTLDAVYPEEDDELVRETVNLESRSLYNFQIDQALSLLIHSDTCNVSQLLDAYGLLDQVIQAASDARIVHILSKLPSCDGSAYPFSFGLFHPRPEIHLAAARIIQRIFVQKLGSEYVNPMILETLATILEKRKEAAITPKSAIQSALPYASNFSKRQDLQNANSNSLFNLPSFTIVPDFTHDIEQFLPPNAPEAYLEKSSKN